MNKKLTLRIYGRDDCHFCQEAVKFVLGRKDISYEYRDVNDLDNLSRLKKLRPEVKTVPQIFILDNGEEMHYIGGYEDLISHVARIADPSYPEKQYQHPEGDLPDLSRYTTPLAEFNWAAIMPIRDFLEMVMVGAFIDYDGHGHPAKDGYVNENFTVRPSQADQIPRDATHIVWFNK